MRGGLFPCGEEPQKEHEGGRRWRWRCTHGIGAKHTGPSHRVLIQEERGTGLHSCSAKKIDDGGGVADGLTFHPMRPSTQFKQLLCQHNRETRDAILYQSAYWLLQQERDAKAGACSVALQRLCIDHSQPEHEWVQHPAWKALEAEEECVSFQEMVNTKLFFPISLTAWAIPLRRRKAPKKIRRKVWHEHFGDSMSGACFSCKRKLKVWAEWDVLSLSQETGLRPVCMSCRVLIGEKK